MNPQPNQTQLFDLVQRPDGAWVVWTRKSQLDLKMVDRSAIEAARGSYSDEEWAEFIRQPHISDPTVWVIAATYPTRPATDAVLELLGVKRRPRPPGSAPNSKAPRRQQPAAAAVQTIAA